MNPYVDIAYELVKEASLAPLLGAALGAAAPPAMVLGRAVRGAARIPFAPRPKAHEWAGAVLGNIPIAMSSAKKQMLVGALLGGGLGLSYDQMRRPDFKEESELR